MSYRRFYDCSVSERLLYTSFIILLGIGYIFAQVLIFIDVAPEDGKPGLSVEDINIKYRGNRSGTRLEQALMGNMRAYRTPEEFKVMAAWIHDGAKEDRYNKEIRPILEKRCLGCHSPASGMNIPDLGDYKTIKALGDIDRGEPLAVLVRVSHIHLFGMSIIFYLLGRIFILSEMPIWLKRTIVIIPFAAIVVDIGSWWFTKYGSPFFAYTVMLGGAIFGLSFAVQSIFSLYQMWFVQKTYERRYMGSVWAEGGEYRRRGEG